MENNIALLSIDMQNDFVLPGAPLVVDEAHSRIAMMMDVIAFFRNNAFPVIHIRRQYRSDGSDVELVRRESFLSGSVRGVEEDTDGEKIIKELTPISGEYTIIKPRFSAFLSTSLDLLLRRLAIKTLVLIGVNTANCIRTTAYDGISLDYDVIVIADATAAATKEITEANLQDMARIGIKTPTFQDFIRMFPLTEGIE